ncbi:MAG: asparagine synthetase B family protein [Kiloniellaceae bacterium]
MARPWPRPTAVIEPESGRTLLAIDRFAIHAMCVAPLPGGGLAFGATTEAVRAHPAVNATLTPQAVFDFLLFYVCPAPRTVYHEQSKLLPGQYLLFEDGRTRTDFYWRMPYQEDQPGRFEDLAAELDARLEGAVRRAVEGEDPARIGAFLSGGLDSSAVTGMLKRATARRPRTFTVVFRQEGYDESSYARAAARYFDASYQDYALTPKDALDLIPEAAAAYDEPFGNSSAIPTYYCAKMARGAGMDLLLAGDGGDEIFGGNERYVQQIPFEAYGRLPGFVRAGLLEPAILGLPWPRGIGLVRKARNYISYARTPLPDRLEALNYWRGIDLAGAFDPAALREIDPDAPMALRREVYGRAGSGALVHRMMHLDLTTALADNDLRKVNRMCALAGVRVRYPFLDEDLAAFAARVPPRVLVRGRALRDFFKRALKDFLPPETLSKQKHGFGMPFEEWLKQDPDLRALTRETVSAFRRRGYLQPAFLDRIIEGHGRAAPAPGDGIVWDIVMLELWLRAHGHG